MGGVQDKFQEHLGGRCMKEGRECSWVLSLLLEHEVLSSLTLADL